MQFEEEEEKEEGEGVGRRQRGRRVKVFRVPPGWPHERKEGKEEIISAASFHFPEEEEEKRFFALLRGQVSLRNSFSRDFLGGDLICSIWSGADFLVQDVLEKGFLT